MSKIIADFIFLVKIGIHLFIYLENFGFLIFFSINLARLINLLIAILIKIILLLFANILIYPFKMTPAQIRSNHQIA
jgi:hypothetical protein